MTEQIQSTSASLSKKTGDKRKTMGVAKRCALSQNSNNINNHNSAKVQHLHSQSSL